MKTLPVCLLGCQYIDFVLSDPNLKIFISPAITNAKVRAHGSYSKSSHSITFSTLILQDIDYFRVYRTILHEFWHAYKALVHTQFDNPAMLTSDFGVWPGALYDRNANNAQERRKAFISAIEKGDAEILQTITLLMNKYNNQIISADETDKLNAYLAAAHTYVPERYSHTFKNESEINIKEARKAIKKDGYYVHKSSEKEDGVRYIEKIVKKPNGEIQVVGSNAPYKDHQVAALIEDIKVSRD